MSLTQEKAIHAIPLSTYPPISLERPLKLFGKTFGVYISTGLTFSPDTLLQSALGMSLKQLLRNYDKQADIALKNLWRGASGKNKLSETTRTLIKQKLDGVYPSDVLDDILAGCEPTSLNPWKSDWEALQQGMGECREDIISKLVARLVQLDRLFLSVRQLCDDGSPDDGMTLLTQHIGHPHENWRQYNPNLILSVALLVDISLQTLAWLELQSATERSVNHAEVPVSKFLLMHGKKPIGHWLLKMQQSAGCNNLREFSALMAVNGIKRHEYYVSHELLKKWSSGAQLMPKKGCECVLKAVGSRLNKDRECASFAIARFLSFLCDLLIAGTRGEPPSWVAAQEQIYRRYGALYELERSRLSAS